MTTGTKIIESALKKIGAHSIAAPADAESIELGMDTLNSMLQSWLSSDIDLGIVPLKVPGDELGEPLDTRLAIINNLAVMIAPEFENGAITASATLVNNANESYNRIKNLYQKIEIPNKVVSSTLPRGAGNNRGAFSRVYSGIGATIDSSDA